MSYKSPINIVQECITTEVDGEIVKTDIKAEMSVDNIELLKALEYDRNQYVKGYEDAKEKYEKALDKACEELAYKDNCLIMSPEEWKEWCLKD